MQNKEEKISIIQVRGWSMYPNIKDADFVILKKIQPNLGDVVCFKKGGKYIIHRVIKLKKDYLVTKGDNNLKFDPPVKKIEIIGTGIAIERDNKILAIKGKYLYGYFYPLAWIVVLLRKIFKILF